MYNPVHKFANPLVEVKNFILNTTCSITSYFEHHQFNAANYKIPILRLVRNTHIINKHSNLRPFWTGMNHVPGNAY